MGILNSLSNKDTSENNIEKTLTKIQVKDIMSKKLITTPYSTTVYQIS
ncbi:MAG: signal transduction protein, partial [Nitrosopumilales archaeon CG11_big_fil_rev_8_21_14_0_20_33_24]